MPGPVGRELIESFFRTSRPSIEALAEALSVHSRERPQDVAMFRFHADHREVVAVPSRGYLLRTSVEYANPQVTLEELQGIVVARLLEATGSYVQDHPIPGRPTEAELDDLQRMLRNPPSGPVFPFLMNVDDVEPDRYSVNPLRSSLVTSGQSGRPSANVALDSLEVDRAFATKYRGSLVADADIEEIERVLADRPRPSYVDFVDRVKYAELERLSRALEIDLSIPSFRMPIATLEAEDGQGLLHRIISESHEGLESLRSVYRLFSREIRHRKTLLPAVPISPHGVASKRAARGRLLVQGTEFVGTETEYRSSPLYPNEVDRSDVAQVVVDDEHIELPAERWRGYDFRTTPASPQFALYMIASPEDGALWHGVGHYAGLQIVRSYTAFRRAFDRGELFPGIPRRPRSATVQFDLVASKMLVHPTHGNIDASVACVADLPARVASATTVRLLSAAEIEGPGPPAP